MDRHVIKEKLLRYYCTLSSWLSMDGTKLEIDLNSYQYNLDVLHGYVYDTK